MEGIATKPSSSNAGNIHRGKWVGRDTAFTIAESGSRQNAAALPPDSALCPRCEADLFDPRSRRYFYPFTSCTGCGPRFTMARQQPYDRSATAMVSFPMCPACREEYENPVDRRFHAQPTACPACGPAVSLVDGAGRPLAPSGRTEGCDPFARAPWLEKAWHLLREGAILAIKSLGGFHLACDGTSAAAIEKLRRRKGRPCKPLAVMCRDRSVVEKYCLLSEAEHRLLASPAAPIVLLRRRRHCPLPETLAPNLNLLGVMLPYTPLHRLLLHGPLELLVMTSGNLSGLPLITDNEEALNELKGIADCFLLHDREIVHRCDDSVAAVVDGETHIYRRSRGYVPLAVAATSPAGECFTVKRGSAPCAVRSAAPGSPIVLGSGAEMKNTFCLLKGGEAILSQHLGAIDNEESLNCYRQSLDGLQQLLGLRPEIIGYDLHPHYLVSRAARELPGIHVGVQHHHAHLASCLAENGYTGKAVGIILDGSGYGSDGNLWVFEILRGDCCSYTRRFHLAYMPLPGGEKAVRSPWVMAVSCLLWFCGEAGGRRARRIFPEKRAQVDLLERLIGKKTLTLPLACGCGRLFDAISALLGVCLENSYEGQAAIELSERLPAAAASSRGGAYSFTIRGQVIEPAEMFAGILGDLEEGLPPKKIVLKFHNTVAAMAVEAACLAAREEGLRTIALSGGCWQNRYLFTTVKRELQKRGFAVLYHRLVPANDGGLALGQAVVARNLGVRA